MEVKKIIIILFISIAWGSIKECGTILDLENYKKNIKNFSDSLYEIKRNEMPDIIWAPITFHIVRSDNGIGGLPPHRIDIGLADILDAYENANILPYQLGNIDYIDDSDFLSIDSYEEMDQLRQINVVENSINIYAVDILNNGENDLCGISTFTWYNTQGIIMANSCFATSDNHSTLAHEIGHYFNLFHTHQGSSDPDENGVVSGNSTEYVDGTECSTRGDGLCDTSADPNLSDLVGDGCEYIGEYVDGHGDLFNPDETNLMSYSTKNCRTFLSNDQNIKSIYTIETERPELNYPPVNPFIVMLDSSIVEFSGDGDGVINPNEVAALNINIQNWENWPDANNVIIDLISDSPHLNIIDGSHNIDILSSGETYSTVGDPFKIETSSELGTFNLKAILTSETVDGMIYTKEFSIKLEVSLYQQGFPLIGYNQVESSPYVYDINQDGEKEIIFGDYDGLVHCIDLSGIETNGFPVNLGDDIWGAPAIADLNLDGDFEIIVASKNGSLNIINKSGVLDLVLDLDQFLMGTPAIGNFDYDNDLEIAIAGYSNSSYLHVINYDGSPVENFPLFIGEKVLRGPSIYDIDENGLDDIVIATESNNIYLIHDNGNIANGFPFTSNGKFKSSPSILSLNDDVFILAGCRDGYYYAINSLGEIEWSFDAGSSISTSTGFVNLNNKVGLFFGTDLGLLYGLDENGHILQGFPLNTNNSITITPSFSDLDNDGQAEIIFGNSGGQIFSYSIDAVPKQFFPVNGYFSIIGSPSISDIDLDDDLELVFGTTAGVSIVDYKSLGNNENYWNMYKGNMYRKGSFEINYEFECDNFLAGDLDCNQFINVSDVVIIVSIILDQNQPNFYQGEAGDLNNDNILDILDIISIINNILGS